MFLLKAFTDSWIGDSITCYRDSGRGRKASSGRENSLREISQKDKSQRDQTREAPGSEADLKERYLNEIDPRRSFREY
jgi:hypothetical protein